ncbi:MAG: type II toxin-antitoxin system HicB family antitoxin [Candidatus Paceibacterota bacterium]|jgi:predicted RNase H-like HicB family nuclease
MRKQIYNYTAVFERNENGGYTVLVPALPGLVTEGKNLDDARAMATEAIQCYLEGFKSEKIKMPVENDIASMRLSVSV